MAASENSRFAYVDALRALAAILVVWNHVVENFQHLPGQMYTALPLTLAIPNTVDLGRIGVLIFFLISGFVIPNSIRGDRIAGARSFVIRRFFRLYPLYWLSIPLALATIWWAFGKHIGVREIVLNFTMLQQAFGARDIETMYWTLRVELDFYLLCLLLFSIGRLSQGAVLSSIAMAIIPVTTIVLIAAKSPFDFWQIWTSDYHVFTFMFVGALWRKLIDGDIDRFSISVLSSILFIFMIVFPTIGIAFYHNELAHPTHLRLFASYSIAPWIFVLGTTVLRCSWRWAAYLGQISYSIYLMHSIVLYGIYWILIELSKPSSVLQSLPLAAYLTVVLALTIGVSAVTYRFVEQPAIRLGVNLAARKGRRFQLAEEAV